MSDTKAQIWEAQRTPNRLNVINSTVSISYSNFRKPKIEKNIERSQRTILPVSYYGEDQGWELYMSSPQKHCKVGKTRAKIFWMRRKKTTPPTLNYIKLPFKKWRRNKHFLRQTNHERMCCQCIQLLRNLRISSERQEMIEARNLDLHGKKKILKNEELKWNKNLHLSYS